MSNINISFTPVWSDEGEIVYQLSLSDGELKMMIATIDREMAVELIQHMEQTVNYYSRPIQEEDNEL